jgi:short-subunit dehydrogenase
MDGTRNHFGWLITGASQGFGRALTAEVLSRGETVVAAVRAKNSLRDLGDRYPDQLRTAVADLREPGSVERVMDVAREWLGTPDVLVNNAGRAIVGAVEELSAAELREEMELNFFAAVALTRTVLPMMRERSSGTIIHMSSQGGRMSFPGAGGYSASKFALEGWTEALAQEVAAFGVRVMLVEPSRFRTGFNTPRSLGMARRTDVYAAVLDPIRADLTGADGVQEGDPARAAIILADLAHSSEVPLRLPLGAEAVERIGAAYTRDLAGLQHWADVARSADYPDAAPSSRPV